MPLMVFMGSLSRRSAKALKERAQKADARGWPFERRQGGGGKGGGKGRGRWGGSSTGSWNLNEAWNQTTRGGGDNDAVENQCWTMSDQKTRGGGDK